MMSQSRRNRRKAKKIHENQKEKIAKEEKLYGIWALVVIVIAAFLFYFFVLKGNIHRH